MSKKDKSKFRRRLKAQIMQEFAQPGSQNPTAPAFNPPKAETAAPLPKAPIKNILPASQPPLEIKNDSLTWVRKDLKKSAIIIGSIIIVIVSLYLINQRTDFLLSFGNKLFEALHIGA